MQRFQQFSEKLDFENITYRKGKKFVPPYSNGSNKDSHVFAHHDGKEYSHTGKTGTHIKSGEKSWEYSHTDNDGEHRIWIRQSGKVDRD